MKLLTKSLERRFAQLGNQNGIEDPVVLAKFFYPAGAVTWYAMSYDPEHRVFFGLVQGMETEFGPFPLDELEAFNGPFGLGIERDALFSECALSELQAQLGVGL